MKKLLDFIFWKLKIWLGIPEFYNDNTRKYKNFQDNRKY